MKINKIFLLIIFSILSTFILLFYYLYTYFPHDYKIFVENFLEEGNLSAEIKWNISREGKPESVNNKTNEAETSIIQLNEALGNQTVIVSQQKNYTKTTTTILKIVDICSGKLENVFSISEGTRKCLNSPSPYDILLEKNSTHIMTNILNYGGFNETFEMSDATLIYFLFIEDIKTISSDIENVHIEGSNFFFLGDYEIQTIWETSSAGNLNISKMILILPLYIKGEIDTDRTYNLTFYLSLKDKNLYVGEMRVAIRNLEK